MLARFLQICVLAALAAAPGGTLGVASAAAAQNEAADCCTDCADEDCPEGESDASCPPLCNDCMCASFLVVAVVEGGADSEPAHVHRAPLPQGSAAPHDASRSRVFRPPRA